MTFDLGQQPLALADDVLITCCACAELTVLHNFMNTLTCLSLEIAGCDQCLRHSLWSVCLPVVSLSYLWSVYLWSVCLLVVSLSTCGQSIPVVTGQSVYLWSVYHD